MKRIQPIYIILVLAFIIGIAGLTHRGESWDEFLLHRYASRSLDAYRTWAVEGDVKITLDDLGGYGPAFVMLGELVFRLLEPLLSMNHTDIYHLINFVVFLVGIWAFYDLGIRWLPRTEAVGATILLITQPVIWGHAFMNSKDIPFFSFFALSIALGLRMMDSCEQLSLDTQSVRLNRRLVYLSAFWLVSVFGLFIATGPIHTFVTNLVTSAYKGQHNIVSILASDLLVVPPEIYVQKFFVLFLRMRLIFVVGFTFLLGYSFYRFSRSTFLAFLPVILPGIMIGFTASIRVLGPLAGLIVAFYGLRKRGRTALPIIMLYMIIAIITMYLSWPYLWENPPGHIVESITLMASYPWNRDVLFDGARYAATALPYSYLPKLFLLQITETTWPLFLIGLYGLIRSDWIDQANRKEGRQALLELVSIWFIIPFALFIAFRPSLYDNFRQLLFILPPAFLAAGFALTMVKHTVWKNSLIAVAILPGLIANANLYPYEYIYYNEYIGGIRGAQNKYELDYWATSYRKAAEYINNTADPNAYVWVEGPAHIFESYARADLKILDSYTADLADRDYYVVIQVRYGLETVIAPDAETIEFISMDGVPLTVIKRHQKEN